MNENAEIESTKILKVLKMKILKMKILKSSNKIKNYLENKLIQK